MKLISLFIGVLIAALALAAVRADEELSDNQLKGPPPSLFPPPISNINNKYLCVIFWRYFHVHRSGRSFLFGVPLRPRLVISRRPR